MLKKLVVIVAILFFSVSLSAQVEDFHALYLYHFMKRIEWPAASVDTFRLMVVGSPAIAAAMDTIAQQKTIGALPIKIRAVEHLPAALGPIQMLYIAYGERRSIALAKQKIGKKSILLISDKTWNNEADIQLEDTDTGLEFFVNERSIRNKALKVGDDLLRLSANKK